MRQEERRWYCIECDARSDEADQMTMHSANFDHQPFFGTESDRDLHRGVVAKGRAASGQEERADG